MYLFSYWTKTMIIWKIELISFLEILSTETSISNAITSGSIYLYSTLSQKEYMMGISLRGFLFCSVCFVVLVANNKNLYWAIWTEVNLLERYWIAHKISICNRKLDHAHTASNRTRTTKAREIIQPGYQSARIMINLNINHVFISWNFLSEIQNSRRKNLIGQTEVLC